MNAPFNIITITEDGNGLINEYFRHYSKIPLAFHKTMRPILLFQYQIFFYNNDRRYSPQDLHTHLLYIALESFLGILLVLLVVIRLVG